MKYRFNHPDVDDKRRAVHSHVMLPLLGVRKLPLEGLPARMLPGRDSTGAHTEIKVWVAAHVPKFAKVWNGSALVEKRVKTSVHRVRCECPGCGKEFSAGRLFQHWCNGPQVPKSKWNEYQGRQDRIRANAFAERHAKED